MKWIFAIYALVAGALMPIQAGVNLRLRFALGDPIWGIPERLYAQHRFFRAWAFSSDQTRLVTGGEHRTVSGLFVWDVATGRPRAAGVPEDKRGLGLTFSPDGQAGPALHAAYRGDCRCVTKAKESTKIDIG